MTVNIDMFSCIFPYNNKLHDNPENDVCFDKIFGSDFAGVQLGVCFTVRLKMNIHTIIIYSYTCV